MKVAALQLNSGKCVEENLATVTRLLSEAAAEGVTLALLPENFAYMGLSEQEKRHLAQSQKDGPILHALSHLAAKHKMTIIGGTLLLKGEGHKLRNSSPVFDDSGRLLALYDKIHLFDMDYRGERYAESDLIEAGDKPVSVNLGAWRAGLSTCYDLRFPELFRRHVDAGCQLLCNVAAFTATTGAAHWQPLLRARAIENQCYMIASAQWGSHADGRKTWGHSMIIDPWGRVIDELEVGDGYVVADLSLEVVEHVRQSMPVLQHRRL